MVFTPDDSLNFGKNKGCKLRLIFKYNPTYIEWLIKNVDHFAIDMEKFKNLPDPTPVDTYRMGIIEGEPEVATSVGSQIKSFFFSMPGRNQQNGLRNNWNYTVNEALNPELKGVVIPSIKYSFPEDVITINEGKQSKLNQTL
jgi:hypothetical protein